MKEEILDVLKNSNLIEPALCNNFCVVTAADERFYIGVLLLRTSLNENIQLVIINIGLTEEQAESFRRIKNTKVITLPDNKFIIPKTVSGWQTWNKIVYINECEYDNVLWIDADCVVLGDISPIINRVMDTSVVFTEHSINYNNNCGSPTQPFYDEMPTNKRLMPGEFINAGVMGFNKKSDLYEEIYFVCMYALSKCSYSKKLRDCCCMYDEPVFYWVIERQVLGKYVVPKSLKWNILCLEHYSSSDFVKLIQKYKHDGVVILHFSSSYKKKIWESW